MQSQLFEPVSTKYKLQAAGCKLIKQIEAEVGAPARRLRKGRWNKSEKAGDLEKAKDVTVKSAKELIAGTSAHGTGLNATVLTAKLQPRMQSRRVATAEHVVQVLLHEALALPAVVLSTSPQQERVERGRNSPVADSCFAGSDLMDSVDSSTTLLSDDEGLSDIESDSTLGSPVNAYSKLPREYPEWLVVQNTFLDVYADVTTLVTRRRASSVPP